MTATAPRPDTHYGDLRVGLSEVLAALSYALDLTEGQPPGHTVRTCLIGMRLAADAGLDDAERSALYYALLLKDAGCSSNAARFAALFGADDRAVKPRLKAVDLHRRARLAFQTARSVGLGRSILARAIHFFRVARTPDVTRTLIQVRCDRGAAIAGRLGFPEATVEAIRSLDEHWCGLGYARGLSGDDIPLLARIALLAQTMEAYHAQAGVAGALRVAQERRATWFDPRLVDLTRTWDRDPEWWHRLADADAERQVVAIEPPDLHRVLNDEGLDEIARAFADIIDAKSPYTFQHSARVADYAIRIAVALGVDAVECQRLYRAGLLHDVGKLGVSSRILDKPGRLTADERGEIERHPAMSFEILNRVNVFRGFARMASLHHEKLDGSGYPWGVGGDELEEGARILAVADIYDALTSERPYRGAMSPGDAMAIIARDRGPRLCARVVDALESIVSPAQTDEPT